jgi:hypothetical protein
MLADVPFGFSDVHCPVILAQGTADIIASGQTPRYLLTLPSAAWRTEYGYRGPELDVVEQQLALTDLDEDDEDDEELPASGQSPLEADPADQRRR